MSISKLDKLIYSDDENENETTQNYPTHNLELIQKIGELEKAVEKGISFNNRLITIIHTQQDLINAQSKLIIHQL